MSPIFLKGKLIKVLRDIQRTCLMECPPLDGTTLPVKSIPKFDSPLWPVATTLLAEELGECIPNDVNIFFDASTKQPLTIDQIVAFTCALLSRENGPNKAAA